MKMAIIRQIRLTSDAFASLVAFHGQHSDGNSAWLDGQAAMTREAGRNRGEMASPDATLPATIAAGDPLVPRYNDDFALDKTTGQ